MALEIECKYLHVDFATLQETLVQMQAHKKDLVFESNAVFDTDPSTLLACGKLLRLRRCFVGNQTRKALLTLKLPQESSLPFKVREEREVTLDDADTLGLILEGLGYKVVGRYEKVRESWELSGVQIDLDRLPFGNFVELEGKGEDIVRVAASLGLDRYATSTSSYHALHQEWLHTQGLSGPKSFVFAEELRRQIYQELGIVSKQPNE